MAFRTTVFVLAASLVACGEVNPPLGPAPESDTTPADGSTEQEPSSSATAEAKEPSKGGSPPKKDAGVDTDDPSATCAKVAPGSYRTFTCAGTFVALAGGALVSGTFKLASVTVWDGGQSFCDYTFYANEQRGGLQVVAASTTSATLKRYDEWRRPSDPSYTTPERVDSKVEAQGAELTIEAQDCLPGVFVKFMKFETGVSEQGKRFIVLRSSYGPTGIADYRYEEP